MSNHANYAIILVESNDEQLVIRDIGPHHLFRTITNDAEHVVMNLASQLDGRRLFYYDSDGQLGEICHEDGRFAGFAPPGPR